MKIQYIFLIKLFVFGDIEFYYIIMLPHFECFAMLFVISTVNYVTIIKKNSLKVCFQRDQSDVFCRANPYIILSLFKKQKL